LILLYGDSRVLEAMVGQISEQFAERFGAMKHPTLSQAIDCIEISLSLLQ